MAKSRKSGARTGQNKEPAGTASDKAIEEQVADKVIPEQDVFPDPETTDKDAPETPEHTVSDDIPDQEVERTEETGDIVKAEEAADTDQQQDSETETVESDTDQDDSNVIDGTAETVDEVEETPREEPVPAETPAEEVVVRGNMWPAVFGGVIAAMLGFIAGRGDQIDQWLPASMQRGSVDLSILETLETQAAGLVEVTQAQSDRLAALESQPAPVLEVPEELAAATEGLTETVAVVSAELQALAERLDALEARPVETAPEGASAADVAALQQALDAQKAEIEALSTIAEEAEAAARSEAARILARAALTRVVTAVDSGETFEPAIDDLEEVAPVDVPDALRTAAAEGVPTMATLRETFPDAARDALAAARSDVPESEVQGIGAFLRRQLSARSVTPREGSDPDAILSRAEAAIRQGDLATALSEMEALPEPARAAMQGWLSSAEARRAAQDAANTLSDSLQSN
ncbi:hypothetical protein [uncultured Roseobacter sp.]|uniref:COG4223 family protein n=1 Tax=uncultured Roseobacter sp. TaxID=114847 RepID=UPI002636126C|nr:hypothetical protein [uncultured Roseobacter sp.]